MAATDKHYRNQHTLDIVFGVSCLLMLGSIVWMFAQDYFREFKVEQRVFYDVESAMAQREMLELLPDAEKYNEINTAMEELAKAVQERDRVQKELDAQIKEILPQKVSAEARAQALKAELDSEISLLNIAIEERNATEKTSPIYQRLARRVEAKKALVERIRGDYLATQRQVEEFERQLEEIRKKGAGYVEKAVAAESKLKRLTEDFERFAKLTVDKEWSTSDWVRSLPVIDAFASPIRIHQYTLNDLPINYNFKYVTRYDRCKTCHLGIDKPAYTKSALRELTLPPGGRLENRLRYARWLIKRRREVLPMLDPIVTVEQLPKSVDRVRLSEAQINEFCAHPRQDLFVAANSPHGAEKFGCTICHEGQGSGTSFNHASHTPNDYPTEQAWVKAKSWQSNHYWDFPMLPNRFIESSCLKCHHDVTDLLPNGNEVEYRNTMVIRNDEAEYFKEEHPAPGSKVVAGYNRVRLFGCFGCHEISGIKQGRPVGPDLRLEPYPPLDWLSADAKKKALSDPTNPPGTMRRVGPSLRRLHEKTNEEWVRKWLSNPRGFRPDTRMPHFYHLSNNNEEALRGTGQEEFPDAELHAIVFYLFRKSEAYTKDIARYYELNKKSELSKEEAQELASLSDRLLMGADKSKVDPFLVPLKDPDLPAGYKENPERGRRLFTEKGCLACHAHSATETPSGRIPALKSKADFGPNLSRLAAKLGDKPGDAKAKRWLVQWILNPQIHHPRTFMPVTHLRPDEAADIASWLLSQKTDWQGEEVAEPSSKALRDLARVYLQKTLPSFEVDELFSSDTAAKLQEQIAKEDQDIAADLDVEGKLKIYIGRKSLNQLGCFGCHDIPGFEKAKPIGTPLNDWGRKDPERLAFEDAIAFAEHHYYPVDRPVDRDGKAAPIQDGKEPYERYFLEALAHHDRKGFLYQKLRNPRSFDYDRERAWDERLRMPQFKFARGASVPGDDSEAGRVLAEAQARETVMTFVLGLVAEPIPLQFVHQPSSDKRAIVEGKKVLDKYNCAGCHQLAPGRYEFKATEAVLTSLENSIPPPGDPNLGAADPKNPFFSVHNAWVGRLSPDPDRVTIHGLEIEDPDEKKMVQVLLTHAVRFNRPADRSLPLAERQKKAVDIPAPSPVQAPRSDLLYATKAHGGTLVDLLMPYLLGVRDNYSPPQARAELPPPLLREGEKVQPDWLFRFLRDPQPLRPPVILRMPRFNMSEEEARTLVNYFAAVDRLSNPGIGLDYPYFAIPQRDPDYIKQKSASYTAKLKQQPKAFEARIKELRGIWRRQLREEIENLSGQIEVKKRSAKSDAEKDELQNLMKRLQQLQSEAQQPAKEGDYIKQLRLKWEQEESYATDSFRLVATYQMCLQCHKTGNLQPGKEIGPPLDLSADRLRPEWTLRWLASPQRLLVYRVGNHPMPANFNIGKTANQNLFLGTPFEQATAARDLLMFYPRAAAMPANRFYIPPSGASSP
ncbi:MAG: hypothetical protein KatS3mg105_1983 [Gemmatales bacterium]|nr:MAG: hypothetical protein KatS3mg105_1983 [Gemmatales bacterium]